ncbi:DUF371 domain-containing protein [Halobacteriales archaeon QS_8_69_26]|nr:MAG: DUF371 domain-containing protein [Halobacteriales archaeon QS_8_69_26]
MGYRQVVTASGHENVTAAHGSTFEVTTDDYLTPAGDCILGIEADRAASDFDPEFVAACQDRGAAITVTVRAGGHEASVAARGDPDLTFDSDRSCVVRTSDHVDDRTVAVGAEHAADGFDHGMVEALSDGAELTFELTVET